MFDINKVGRKISQLRRENNMTQMELADKLNISFQAVSNWERGQTMPDIAKLYELSEIFDVPIDDLLENERGTAILNAVQKKEQPEQPISAEELADVAPLLKPEQTGSYLDSMKENLSLRELVMLAPFVETGFIDEMAQNAAADGSFGELRALLPFVSTEAAGKLFLSMADKAENLQDLAAVAPFCEEGLIDEAALRICERTGQVRDIVSIAPFMSQGAVGRCALSATDRNTEASVAGIAPFIDSLSLGKIAALKIERNGIASITEILPFLDSELLQQVMRDRYAKPRD